MAKETKKYVVGDIDDNGNIARVDARGTCDNEPVFNRVSEKKKSWYPVASRQRPFGPLRKMHILSLYILPEHQCASACT